MSFNFAVVKQCRSGRAASREVTMDEIKNANAKVISRPEAIFESFKREIGAIVDAHGEAEGKLVR